MSSGKIIFFSVSENQSILVMPPWRNWSLLTAITASMLLHFLILYAPFMKVWFCLMFFLICKIVSTEQLTFCNSSYCSIRKWVDVFKNGPSKICRKQPLKNLKWYGLRRQQNYVRENCSKLALKAPKKGQMMRNLEQISLTHVA